MASDSIKTIPLVKRVSNWLWASERVQGHFIKRIVFTVLRYLAALIRDINSNLIRLHAVNFVYTILLSLVPVLALCFAVLKGLNIHRNDDVINLLQQFLQPLGPKSTEVAQRILQFVENLRGDLLSLFGVIFLLYTVISMIRKLEVSFNQIFDSPMQHNFAKRLTEYIGALIIAPILMTAALTLGTTISSHHLTQQLSEVKPLGYLILNFGKLVPTLLVIANFTFLYKFIPNTPIKFKNALIGGVVAGITWSIVGFLFASFIASSTRYTAIYSSFAILVVFLMWLYFSCLILLLGARLVYYLEHPQYLRRGSKPIELSPTQRFSLACDIMNRVSSAFQKGETNWTTNSLSLTYNLPARNVEKIYLDLEKNNFLTRDADGHYLPNKQPNLVNLKEIAHALFDTTEWRTRKMLNPEMQQALSESVTHWYQELEKHNLESFNKT